MKDEMAALEERRARLSSAHAIMRSRNLPHCPVKCREIGGGFGVAAGLRNICDDGCSFCSLQGEPRWFRRLPARLRGRVIADRLDRNVDGLGTVPEDQG